METVTFSRWRRLGYAAMSGLTGWLVGQLVCLPINLITAVRDSEGHAGVFVQTLLYGLFIWGSWSLILATAAWVLVVLPLVMTMRPCLLIRLRFVLVGLGVAAALLLVARHPLLLRDTSAVSFFNRYAQFIPYGAFSVTFTLVTAWLYILLSKRRLARAEATN